MTTKVVEAGRCAYLPVDKTAKHGLSRLQWQIGVAANMVKPFGGGVGIRQLANNRLSEWCGRWWHSRGVTNETSDVSVLVGMPPVARV